MFASRGVGSSGRPLGRYGQRAYRLFGLFSLVAVAGLANATFSFTDYPEDICATESIYVDSPGGQMNGVTASGIGYTIVMHSGAEAYSDRYNSFNLQRSTVTVTFDHPVAAVGAMLSVSGYSSYAMSPLSDNDTNGLYVSTSGYRGVIASPGAITHVTFYTDNGPMSALRVDVRPMPLAVNDNIEVFENSNRTYDAVTLLRNDLNADGALLVRPPLHAEKFILNEDGTFVYQPAKNFSGEDSFLYRATNGVGASVSDPATVDIKVLHVNCAPEFVKGADVACQEDDALQTIPGWATAISVGPEEETGQTLTWTLSADNPSLFSVQPTIDQSGTLSYQPALYQAGSTTVMVRLSDDGGTENGGVDSSTQTFTITIEPKAHAPMLEPMLDCAVRPGDALILSARATEVDRDQAVSYSLDQAPEGATINPVSGQIIWRPGSEFSGQIETFVVRATDASHLTTASTFHVEVLQEARPPEILPIDEPAVQPGENAATQIATKERGNVRYFLASTVAGAMLNPITGAFHWQPSLADAGRTMSFMVTAVDLDNPRLCAMKTFSVRVRAQSIALRKAIKNSSLQTIGEAAMKFVPSKPHAKK